MPLGWCTEGFTCSEKGCEPRPAAGEAPGLASQTSLYFSIFSCLRAFTEISFFFFFSFWSPPLMEAGDL